MEHPLLVGGDAPVGWSPVGSEALSVPRLIDLVGESLHMLDDLASRGRGHGNLHHTTLLRHRCGHLAWGAPVAEAPPSPDDIVALGRVAAARMGLEEPVTDFSLLQFVGTFRISKEWMLVLRTMGAASGTASASLEELRLVVDALRYWIEPYAAVIRLTMETDAIVRAERKRVLGLRRRLLLARDHARLIEEHTLSRDPSWSELVSLCHLFGPGYATQPSEPALERAIP